jgi:hypothetical protein
VCNLGENELRSKARLTLHLPQLLQSTIQQMIPPLEEEAGEWMGLLGTVAQEQWKQVVLTPVGLPTCAFSQQERVNTNEVLTVNNFYRFKAR